MLREYPSGRPDFSNIPDLKKDPMLAFQHRYYLPLALATNFGLPLLAGLLFHDVWGMLILAGVLRLVWSHHVTFFINSLAHMWGSRPYTEDNSARDNPVLAVITYGEGYHNFHHMFAHDYRNGVRWWQWDPTKWLIAVLQLCRPHAAPEAHAGVPDPARAARHAVHARAGAARRAPDRATRTSSSCGRASRTSTRASSPRSPTGRASRSSGWTRRKRIDLQQAACATSSAA